MSTIVTISVLKDYLTLCKPRVVLLMIVTAWVGMHLASYELIPWQILIFASLGIAFAAASAAIINHLLDRHIDAKMKRTATRPIACGRITPTAALLFAATLAILAFIILITFVNFTTTWLTFATLLGYALLYTVFLKRATPQNIVIGGAAGAMPPLLGWTAVAGSIEPNGLLLVLIIFTWTPPHFWALAIYRKQDYAAAHIPMLPNTHGVQFTKLCILLYTILLIPITILPYLVGMSGMLYLSLTLVIDLIFVYRTIVLYRSSNIQQALKIFHYSIIYLLLLFVFLLLDHYASMFDLLYNS